MRHLARALTLIAPLTLACCDYYDAPPSVAIPAPEGGAFVVDTPVVLRFDRAIEPSSLSFAIWPSQRGTEGELLGMPRVARCNLTDCDSDEITITMNDAGDEASLAFNPDGLGRAGQPLILQVLPGLSTPDGAATRRIFEFDIAFRPPPSRVNTEPVAFDNGDYILLATITQPLPATLNLVSNIRVAPSGELALTGAEGREIEGAAKNTVIPEELIVEAGRRGFAIHATGFIKLTDDGKRLLETDPFDASVPLPPMEVRLSNVRLIGEVVKNAQGKDRIEATLSFEGLDLINGNRSTEYDAGSTAIAGEFHEPARQPAGAPTVCGDLCGAVTGTCTPPENFPPAEVCD